MIQIEYKNRYKANKGCLIVRKSDGFIMGDNINLGRLDSINNYEDREFSDEFLDNYYRNKEENLPEENFPIDIVPEGLD